MKRLPISLRVTFTLLAIALLAACAPGDLPSAEEIESAINTSVAMTVEAQGKIAASVAMTVAARETEAAGALPTATLSPTPLSSLTPVLATATPFTVAPSSGSGGGGGGGTTKYAYACDPDIWKRPFDNTEFNPNGTFDITFTILNTGTATWEAGKDLTLLGGSFITAPAWATIELPEMKPGDTFTVGPFDGMAPAASGHYVMDFKLEGGWCYPYIAINVK